MYRDGRGTETDQFKAYGWLALAFENGFQPAEGLMKNFDIGSTEAEKITEKFRQQVNETVRNTDRPRGPACAQ
jgi:TPR repeat protein